MSRCQYIEVCPAATGWCNNAKPTKKCLKIVMRDCSVFVRALAQISLYVIRHSCNTCELMRNYDKVSVRQRFFRRRQYRP